MFCNTLNCSLFPLSFVHHHRLGILWFFFSLRLHPILPVIQCTITLHFLIPFRPNLCARPPFVALRQLVARIPHRTFLCPSMQSEEIRSLLNLSLSCLKIDSQCVFIHLSPQTPWSRGGKWGHGDGGGHLQHHYVHTEKMRHVFLTSVCCPHSKDTNCSHIYIYDTFPLYNWMILMPKLSVTSLIGK